jgi:ribosomal protein S27AE
MSGSEIGLENKDGLGPVSTVRRLRSTCPWCGATVQELRLDSANGARSCPRCPWWSVGSSYEVVVCRS